MIFKFKLILLLSIIIFIQFLIIYFNKSSNRKTLTLPNKKCFIEDYKCWGELITKTAKSEGIIKAFSLLSDYYNQNESFARSCHDYVHILGNEAYKIFSKKGELEISDKFSYCGYGFYHGFMEALLQSTGDLKEARNFCDYIQKKTGGDFFNAAKACYHGFGHGIVDGSNPNTWGNVNAMINPGLELCEKVGETEVQKDLCSSGVFNSLAILYSQPKYKLIIDKSDPYDVCKKQNKFYFKKPCFEEMNTIVLQMSDYDFAKASDRTLNVEEEFGILAIRSLAGFASSFQKYQLNYNELIKICQSLKDSLVIPCLTGFVGGLIEHGPPEREYLLVLEYCSSKLFTDSQRSQCFESFIGYASHRYSKEKMNEICNLVKKRYKNICAN